MLLDYKQICRTYSGSVFVLSNDSHSKIDEVMEELHDMKSLYMDLNS